MTATQNSRPHRTLRRAGFVSTALTAGLILSACDDDPDAASGPVEIGAIDFAFVDMPDRLKAGAVLSLSNDSRDEIHELAAAAEAEGGPPEVAGGPPHIVHGMFAELKVVG